MTVHEKIAAAVMPVVKQWLDTCPGQPLVLRSDSHGEAVEVTIGIHNRDAIPLTRAAELLGVSVATFRSHNFYGLKRGLNKKFSRLAVERQRDRMRG